MSETKVQSKFIEDLKNKISNNENAEKLFWEEIEALCTPIIEEIDGDENNNLITYIYKGSENTENVLVIHPTATSDYKNNFLHKISGTNIWYNSYVMRNDVRGRYAFSENDNFEDDFESRFTNISTDSYSKNKIIQKGSDGEEDGIITYFKIPKASEQLWVEERNCTHKGNISEYEIYSKNLEENRTFSIYIPHDYKEEKAPYKFLLLTDGDYYLNTLSAIEVLDNLIFDKKIPPIVTIFLYSNKNRRQNLRCSDSFGSFVANELMPWVRERYNISKEPSEAVVGGFSLGGLTASYLGLKHSELFGNVLSQSGSYWYKPEDAEDNEKNCWMSNQFEIIDRLPLKFYLNVGVLETKDRMIDTNINLRDVLLSKEYSVAFEEFESGHDSLYWGETLATGLISLIGDL